MTLGNRVKTERQARNWSQAELARRVSAIAHRTITQVAIHHIESRGNVSPRFLVELAQALEVSIPWLQHGKLPKSPKGTPTPAQSHEGEQPPLFTPPPSRLPASITGLDRGPAVAPGLAIPGPDIPVWASVAAGNGEGMMILTDTPIDYIRRSDHIANAVDPFAFYIVGDSMEERFYQGDQVVVNRSLPLRPGDDCVFIAHGEDGQLRGLVKRLMRSTAEAWKVRQLNPRKDFDLPKRPWSKAYRIVEIRPRG